MNWNWQEWMFSAADAFVNILARRPTTLALAVAGGVTSKAAAIALSETYPSLVLLKSISSLEMTYFVVLGILIALVVHEAFLSSKVSEQRRETLATLENLMTKANMSQRDRRLVFRKLLEDYIANLPKDLNDVRLRDLAARSSNTKVPSHIPDSPK